VAAAGLRLGPKREGERTDALAPMVLSDPPAGDEPKEKKEKRGKMRGGGVPLRARPCDFALSPRKGRGKKGRRRRTMELPTWPVLVVYCERPVVPSP